MIFVRCRKVAKVDINRPRSRTGESCRKLNPDALRLSPNCATLEVDGLLREPLKLTLGQLHIGLIERGSAYELGYQRVEPVAPADEEAQVAAGLLREFAARAGPFYLEVGFEEPHRPYHYGGATPDSSRGVSVPGYLPDVP